IVQRRMRVVRGAVHHVAERALGQLERERLFHPDALARQLEQPEPGAESDDEGKGRDAPVEGATTSEKHAGPRINHAAPVRTSNFELPQGLAARICLGSRRSSFPAWMSDSQTDPKPTRTESPPLPTNCCAT